MYQALHDAWWRLATQSQPRSVTQALACGTLQMGSAAYRAVVTLRNAAYDRRWIASVRLPCRVVSVGNLTVGGTGKTTCVELITSKLAGRGHRVAILSRGYGGSRRTYLLQWDGRQLLVNGEAAPSPNGLADEPQLLARHLGGIPVIVGARRDHTGRMACETMRVETLVLDDGFQHRRVQRDCDVVLVQARMPLGGWALLPRGPMREPLASLTRAHVVIVTKADEALQTLGALCERLRALNPEADILTASHEPTALEDPWTQAQQDPAQLGGLRVGVLSSIGDPEGFEATVRRMHATVAWHRAFPDHHVYRSAHWASICAQATQTRVDMVVTTEKDWIRLQAQARSASPPAVPLRLMRIRMKLLSGEEALDARLAGVLAR